MKNTFLTIILTVIVSCIVMAQKQSPEFENRLLTYIFESKRVYNGNGIDDKGNSQDSITICKIDKYNRNVIVQFVDSLTMEAKKKMLKARHMAFSYNDYCIDYNGALDEFSISAVHGSKIYDDKISPPMIYINYKVIGGYFIGFFNGEYINVDYAGGIPNGENIELKNPEQGRYINISILQGTDNSLF